MTVRADAHAALDQLVGVTDAQFHPDQFEAIEALVGGRSVLCIQRTGFGKSAIYFIATKLLRQEGRGPTLIVSPLLALMRNQLEAAETLGLNASTINSTNITEWRDIEAQIIDNKIDVLLVSPERLNHPGFRRDVLPSIARHTGLLVIDEAHCISDWGHDFRPDYRRIRDVVANLPEEAAILATTATANDRVQADVLSQIERGEEPLNLRGALERETLRLETVDCEDPAERLARLAELIPQLPRSGVVYTLTVADAYQAADWLTSQGIEAAAYVGGMETDDRMAVEAQLKNNQIKAVVATSALGMGYDKPDLGFVIHMGSPGSIIAYWQQAGRAGRDGQDAHAIMLRAPVDRHVQDYFIRAATPPQNAVDAVMATLTDEPMSSRSLLPHVNLGQSRLELLLKILDVEGAVERVEGGWIKKSSGWSYDPSTYQALEAQRREEQKAMTRFGATDECLQRTVCEQLDDPYVHDCGRCAACTSPQWQSPPSDELLQTARQLLRANLVSLPVKKQWPATEARKAKKIPDELRPLSVQAMARLGDGGWDTLAQAVIDTGVIDSDLVQRAAGAYADCEWVTSVPSRTNNDALVSCAQAIADELGVPYVETLTRVADRPAQSTLNNAAGQFANLSGAHSVHDVPSGRGLLIDDRLQSGWTLSMTAGQLLHAGADGIHALALLQTN